MDENEERTQNMTLYLLLGVALILVTVDSFELYHVILGWEYGMLVVTPVFVTCIKWELYTKTVFATFSLLGAISALLLTILLLINTQWFADKILSTFLYFNYIIFGPYMLGFTILGMANWNNVAYICDSQNKMNFSPSNSNNNNNSNNNSINSSSGSSSVYLNNKILSPANMFSLFGCFILSAMITSLVAIYKTVILYIDSILRKPDGNVILRKLFWWSIFRNREPVDFIRRAQNEQNVQNVENERSNNEQSNNV